MSFSSIEFLFRFLPIFMILYFAVPTLYRNAVLLVGSLFFYGLGQPSCVIFLILSVLVNYFAAERIYTAQIAARVFSADDTDEASEQENSSHVGRFWLIFAMVFNFGMLFIFKYLNFFIGILNDIAGSVVLKPAELVLPVGISFYTFEAASYVIDVYRRRYARASLYDFAIYLCMFPQLLSGPIVNYAEVKDSIRRRKITLHRAECGASIFILGLSYKVLLADKIASLWNDVMTTGVMGIHPLTAWLGAWGYSMQLLFDFFGYSLMAIGLGHILGFKLPTNFRNPYCAGSATEFWRRWHITLGRWFREYVYIPLGGNRKGTPRMILNTFIVWLLTGLWHGANWNFLLWGMFFFILLTVEKVVLHGNLDKHPLISHIYMLFVIPLSWTIFKITDLPTLGNYLKRMFFLPVKGSVAADLFPKFLDMLGTYWWLLLICAFCCTQYPIRLLNRYFKTWPCKLILLALFWYSVYQIAIGAGNPFLYFKF